MRAAPDGYTLSIGHLGTHVINGAIYPLTFDLVKDLDPVALIASNPMMIVSKNDVPAKNLKELIAWIKANDGKVTAGTAGLGSGAHFSGVYFEQLIGAKLQFVPYRGTGPALLDLVAGQIDLIVDQASNSLPQVKAGKIRPYGITADKRLAAAPDVPTVDEAGLPGFHVELWSAIWVPKGTPKDIVAQAQRRGGRGAGRSRGAQAAGRGGPGNSAARQADAGSARRPSTSRSEKMVADDQGC